MTLAHIDAIDKDRKFEDVDDDDGGEEEDDLTMGLTRDESRALYDRVLKMSQRWDTMELGIATALSNDEVQAARQDRVEGRTTKVEDRISALELTMGRHKRQNDPSELDDLEKTEHGGRVVIPIQRASQMVAAEKNEAELREQVRELAKRYMWWKGTMRDAAWGLAKWAGKAIATGALGWLGHAAYVYIKSH